MAFENQRLSRRRSLAVLSVWSRRIERVRPAPNAEHFLKWTKLRELSLWQVQRLSELSSFEWVWIVQHVPSVCFRQKEPLKIVSGTNVHLQMRGTLLKEQMAGCVPAGKHSPTHMEPAKQPLVCSTCERFWRWNLPRDDESKNQWFQGGDWQVKMEP